jgi:hypothetical protein
MDELFGGVDHSTFRFSKTLSQHRATKAQNNGEDSIKKRKLPNSSYMNRFTGAVKRRGKDSGFSSQSDSEAQVADSTSSQEEQDDFLRNTLPDPQPLASRQLRDMRSDSLTIGNGQKISEAAKRRQELVGALGFDVDIAKNSWRSAALPVAGTYNPMIPNSENGHGPGCPLCENLPSISTDESAFNHINVINSIVKTAGNHMCNVQAIASMISSYWNVNVAREETETTCAIPQLTIPTVIDHLESIVLDGMEDAAVTARNIRTLENALMANIMSVNSVTGESRLNKDIAQLLVRIPQVKRVIHETDWGKSKFTIPGTIDQSAINTVVPLIKIFR